MSSRNINLMAISLLLWSLGAIVSSQMFEIIAQEDVVSEFNLDIDEVFLTDLQADKVSTQHLIPAEKGHRSSKELDLQQLSRNLRYLDDDSVASLAKNMSCGFCHARLMWGDTGVIQSPNFPEPYGSNMDCLWLLQAADEDAQIKLTCDTIELESCGAQNGFAPSWRDYLIISPLWNFKKSWVYCGFATTMRSITHTSICSQMAITFRSNNNHKNFKGFNCTYTVV